MKLFNENYRPIDYAIVYVISQRFILPFNKWKAYKLGIIDENGNILRPLKTAEDRKAFTPLDNICLRIKKIIPKHLWYLLSYTQIFKGFEYYSGYRSYYESQEHEKKVILEQITNFIKNNDYFTEEEFIKYFSKNK